jgi:Regulator of chromosome condensation (RCC1) repeat
MNICMQVPGSVGRKIPLGTNRKAVDVAVGESAVCVLLDNGTVKCWGTGSGTGSKYSTMYFDNMMCILLYCIIHL